MKQFNFKRLLAIAFVIAFTSAFLSMAQTSLCFDTPASGYPVNYTFASDDIMHFSKGLNTNAGATCEGSDEGVVRSYRIQDHTFTLQLVSTSASSIVIYGKSSSSATVREVKKVETSTTLDGEYTDITESLSITNNIRYANCGSITINGLALDKNSFVKIYITLPDGTTPAGTNISEVYINPMAITNIHPENTSDKTVVSKKLYSITGQQVDETSEGIIIEKEIYDDGSLNVRKIIK